MIQIVMGTRPEIIKTYSVIKEIMGRCIDFHITFTGQHYDHEMYQRFFEDLDIRKPDENLGIREKTHAKQTGKMLISLENSITKVRPSVLVTIGDTNSALAGCLAAVKLAIPVAHIEAGCRSFDMTMPEEINRVLIDAVASAHFAPSETAINNLLREGKTRETVKLFGNTIVKPLHLMLDRISQPSKKEGVLVTIHRPENTDNLRRLMSISNALIDLGRTEKVTFPMHPRTRSRLASSEMIAVLEKTIKVMKPLGYREFIQQLVYSRVVITDSGGVQEEAAIVGTPCITIRNATEWPETIAAGANTLVPADADRIVKVVSNTKGIPPQDIFKEESENKIVDILSSFNRGK